MQLAKSRVANLMVLVIGLPVIVQAADIRLPDERGPGAVPPRAQSGSERTATTEKQFGPHWFPIGPAPISGGQTYGCTECRVAASGRATVLAVNPFNPDEIFLGAANGGVWHSHNAGLSWRPLSDDQASLAIGAISLEGCSAVGCATVYVGTGENNIRRDTYYGAGLLVGDIVGSGASLTVNWQLRGHDLFNRASITGLVRDPSTGGNSARLYVALSSGVTASATESTVTAPEPDGGYGIYVSENQGVTFEPLDVPGSDGARPTDLETNPLNSNVLYAGFMGRGVFKGTRDPGDGSISW